MSRSQVFSGSKAESEFYLEKHKATPNSSFLNHNIILTRNIILSCTIVNKLMPFNCQYEHRYIQYTVFTKKKTHRIRKTLKVKMGQNDVDAK